jgi:hypothetical protein
MKLFNRISLAWGVLTYKGGGMESFAEHELKLLDSDDPWDLEMRKAVLEVIHVFGSHGHSGLSASVALSMLKRLLAFKPLTPLTGEDDEWTEVAENMWQNKRSGRIFKERMSEPELPPRCYDIDGYVFEGPDGISYTSGKSKKTIAFPYQVGDPEYVKVDADGVPTQEKYRRILGFLK